ncbi:ShlB/FhaC/HecB family hemolysin secretion/activation protein [Pseudomonas sp. KNUC1026]|uniref:ShlB/FhaC/HecB family hemolysin secretion/activation protein n=1 Tax=Pseudomonas sp. KNUC1026 TaxID=2893890 RepID=UPI001F320FDB|nr:ShlB/FhaC/HecB family hemolysin secretion/activation protein [Pseudomonas sp. KNUC1026]UFH48603.1 ShlB/FhaC/HecB family hemolysin secretion/activation protein [Pseudomonas sp. KNUC1026]
MLDLAADIAPGERTGGTHVRLRPLSHPPRAWPTLLLDNRGSASSGRNRALLTFNLDSPARWNDALVLGLQRTLPAGPNFNRSYIGGYSVPRGPWQLSLNAARYAYRSRSPGAYGAIVSQGSGAVYAAALERQLWRDRSSLYSATLRATHKNVATYILGRFSGVQSPTYNSLGVQLDALWSSHGQWNAQVLYSQGLGGWRADDSLPLRDPASPSATFGVWRTSLGHTRSGRVLGQAWHWSSQLSAQYTRNTLPGPDQLNLPGDLSLRGFRDLPASFDRGAHWQNTLSLPRPLPMGFGLVPRLGLDLAQGDGRRGQRGERLAGSVVGASLNRGELALSLDYQHPLYRRQGERPGGYWQLQLQARLRNTQ